MSAENILEIQNVTKLFPGVKALDQVSFSVEKGEIHAVVGENGAGKSTLMHILCGVQQADEGTLLLRDKKARFSNPNQAISAGIGMVFQELSLVNGLNVAENIFANRQPVKGWNIVNWSLLNEKTKSLCDLFGLPIDPDRQAGKLTKSEQQLVEILKAISTDPDLLILDEPTSSLTAVETIKLFDYIKRFKSQGKSCIYISHNLEEIFLIADRVSVLRDGRLVATKCIRDTSPEDLVRLMAGIELTNMYGVHKPSPQREEPFFSVDKLTLEPHFRNISFNLHREEILGFAGLIGSGRTAIGRTLFGWYPVCHGSITLEGRRLSIKSTSGAIQQGIAYVSDDRKDDGLFLQKTVQDNLIANKLKYFSGRFGFLQNQLISRQVDDYIRSNNIVCRDRAQKVYNLSGGNQQKVLLTAWFSLNPKVLIVDEPTRGVDVRSKTQIYGIIHKLAKQGMGIIFISSDIREILGVCTRVLVFRHGSIVADYQTSDVTGEKILAAAAGIGEYSCQEE